MKKLIFTLVTLIAIQFSYGQTTYYWVGGTGVASSFTQNSNWNTVKGSSSAATQRTADAATDILIFDGTDYGSGINAGTAIGIVTSTACGQIVLQNNASVNLQRQTTGSGTITISGGTGDDLVVPTGSSLTISSSDPAGSAIVVLNTTSTGTVSGTVTITGGGCRLACQNTDAVGSLLFQNGSIVNVNVTTVSSYPFGGSAAQTASKATVFKSGSSLIYQGGNSFFGGTSTFNPIVFETGSTAYFDANAASVSNLFNSRTYANVTLRNTAAVTLGDNFYNIDNLTINTGSTMTLRGTGTAPIAGNIVNNGTFNSAAGFTTTHIVMDGTSPQTVGGTGTFGGFGAFSVATNSDVTLNTSLTIGAVGSPTSTISGKLNIQDKTIGGTGAFSVRTAQSVASSPGTLTTGSNDITLNNSVYSSSVNTANVAIGMLVIGTGIPANSYIVATSSGSSRFTISKPATITTATDAASITITGFAPTFKTSNTAGIDGSITTSGAKTFGTENYIFDGATTTPFPASAVTVSANDVNTNAAITLNKDLTVNNVLTLNTGKFTIPAGNTLTFSPTATSVSGAPFSASKYIVTEESGANVGIVRVEGIAGGVTRTLPVGTSNYYMPLSLIPTTTDAFAVSIYEGVTQDGTPNGTAFSAAQKSKVVDAVWVINRVSANSDNCTIGISWPAVLEGATFSSYANNEIGISRYNSGWEVASGNSGDNTTNLVYRTLSTFSPFGVGKIGWTLPVKFGAFSAVLEAAKVKLSWEVYTENNVAQYIIERSSNGRDFISIGTVRADRSPLYTSEDAHPLAGTNFYRIKALDNDGRFAYTSIIRINTGNTKMELQLSPNPLQGKNFRITLSGLDNETYTLSILSAGGQKVYTQALGRINGSLNTSVALPSTLKAGIYNVIVSGNGQQISQRLIVQ